ncbi:hypothetical protein [Bacillus horti]|uniref:Transcriptional regulator n=1 Tax=Caldalkalibacillus horti TaxID=77523 RepID=A0ABT9W2D9_9BACI|nr:hypothetical protein [Bacillus horti]MDQ0167396.1 hypothetical protein [Bacillus horti]
MKLVVGIVGPEDSVKRMINIGSKYYANQLEFTPIIYGVVNEIETLIPEYQAQDIDFWLFSGMVPYTYAVDKSLVEKEEAFYPPLAGSSLYRTFIKVILNHEQRWNRLSFDTLDHDDVENALEDAGLDVQFNTLPFDSYVEEEEVYQYHKELYFSGQVDLCLTCINRVHERLIEDQIPAYRLVPTQNIIKRTFPDILNQAKSIAYQRSQVSVIAIEVDSKEWISLRRKQTYEMKRREQKLEQFLIDFSEKTRGSSVRIGDGLYFIFATWGELEEVEQNQELQSLPSRLQELTKFHIHVGIGNGYTVHEAEANARKALQFAQEKKEPCVMKVLQDGTVMGPLNLDQNIMYSTRHTLASIQKKTLENKDDATISFSTISKIYALSQHYKKDQVTAQELSHWLHVTDRSARRILKELHTLKLVIEVGEEQPGVRGRPRKVYHFKWTDTDQVQINN